MRDLPENFANCPTLCWVWLMTPTTGGALGFTDHDAPLLFQGLTCQPQNGASPGESHLQLGLSVDTGGIHGVLGSDSINSDDLKSGHYDRAKIEMFRVNWQNPSECAGMFSGYLGAVWLRGDVFKADIAGEDTRLERSTGRVFSRMCDAVFGDARCGLNAGDYPTGTHCPRSFSACRDQFSNSVNFRGFPYLLGDDALLAGPIVGETRDGGSRYT